MRDHRKKVTAWLAIAIAGALVSRAPAIAVTISNTGRATYQEGPSPRTVNSNTVTLDTLPGPSPADVEFHQYAPGSSQSTSTPSEGGQCQTGSGGFVNIPVPRDLSNNLIDTTSAEILITDTFHAGEAIFLTLADANRNQDPAAREFVDVRLTTTTGDEELLRLQETGPDTGLFATAIQSEAIPPAPVRFDCVVSVSEATTIFADYADPFYPTDTDQAYVFVDPFGIVFDSSSGLPVDGATVTLVDSSTGLPATVRGDDGVSTFPATLVSGGSTTDSSGRVYSFPPGGFRFPFVPPGDYMLVVTPPGAYTAPSTVPLPVLLALRDPNGDPYSVGPGSFGDIFTLTPGPALNIDIPVDPLTTLLLLGKLASNSEVSAGDFLQYRLTLQNRNVAAPVTNAVITDRLPPGMRYQSGSLRINGRPAPEPAVSSDGATLTITVGTIPPGETVEIAYVVLATAGAVTGQPATNRAVAVADGGLMSNQAQATVRIRDPFLRDRYTLVGRVVEGECSAAWPELKGVGDVRLLLDDGTYASTDAEGLFHFEGVRPGTHVVQLDLDTLPPHLEAVACLQNSRFAGRTFSQFVEAQGGTLWRTDFHLRRRAPEVGTVGIRLRGSLMAAAPGAGRELRYRVELDGAAVPIGNLRVSVMLPAGAAYQPGSSMLDGAAATDPTAMEGVVTYSLGDVGSGWTRVIELSTEAPASCPEEGHVGKAMALFDTDLDKGSRTPTVVSSIPCPAEPPRRIVAAPLPRPEGAPTARSDGTQAWFESCQATLTYDGEAALEDLASRLRADQVERIEVVGHTDSVRLSARCRRLYPDNHALSRARAQAVAAYLQDGLMLSASQVTSEGRGPDEPVADNRTPEGRARNRRVQVLVQSRAQPVLTDVLQPDTGRVEAQFTTHDAPPARVDVDSERLTTGTKGRAGSRTGALSAVEEKLGSRREIPSDATAAGGETDWLAGGTPGLEWLFPPEDHNPRAPTVRVVIQHRPGQKVLLSSAGRPVDPISSDGSKADKTGTVAVSIWRGLALEEGDNSFEAVIQDADGVEIATLSRTVHYANRPLRAVLVPQESVLVADGIHKPVVAVRFLDKDGRPVRAGVTGPYRLEPPHIPAQLVEMQQRRQLAGMDRFQPQYQVAGDGGVAYIELAPTTESGAVVLNFDMQLGNAMRAQEVRAWLEAVSREWVLVGFAQGTVGYDTLSGNLQALSDQGRDEEQHTEGQVTLYAKGSVLGKWLLTLAYDSDKPEEKRRRESLLSTIDPGQFYTLYGDTTQQRYDAASQDKLYVRLERDQFFALFGDYESGMTQTQLTRYSRILHGVKSELAGHAFSYTAYAAETAQNFARDEIQGNGTSGLYRLFRRDLVINSDKVRIETRSRFRSEQIVRTRSLLRHLDYDIDYAAGTLFFREPILSRDPDFNPVFIVAEYETVGPADEEVNAGGRVATHLMDGALTAGAAYIRDRDNLGETDLTGLDLKLKLGGDTELRLEGARSDGQIGTVTRDGGAYLAELEHHTSALDLRAYLRRQSTEFGVGQQNASEAGTFKTGVDAQVRLTDHLALQGQAYRQENLASDAVRDAANAELRLTTDRGGARGGVLYASDEAATGDQFESRQVTLGANRYFFNKKLEVEGGGEFSLGGDNDSIDFPARYRLGAGYAITDDVRLVLSQELTDGDAFNSSTTRAGLQVVPWKGARLTSTLSQSQIQEFGPRTFAQLGLTQSFLLGTRWGLDFSVDSSRTFEDTGRARLVINQNHPIASGGMLSGGSLTEDFTAATAGATYRTELWSWNGRVETRNGEATDRHGLVTSFLRQARAGVAFAMSGQMFRVEQASGAVGTLASADLSWACRPLGSRWSVLDRFELRLDKIEGGSGTPGSGLFGNTSLVASGDATSRRLINNFALNRVSRQWTAQDREGNLFELTQRTQWSIYYGSKYALDMFDGETYQGYTDLLGVEWRHDIGPRLDIGAQATLLHAWSADNYEFSFGPSIGVSPMENAWVTLGYNAFGFRDRDFEAARYTAHGPYLKLRFKFDQLTRWGEDKSDGRVLHSGSTVPLTTGSMTSGGGS